MRSDFGSQRKSIALEGRRSTGITHTVWIFRKASSPFRKLNVSGRLCGWLQVARNSFIRLWSAVFREPKNQLCFFVVEHFSQLLTRVFKFELVGVIWQSLFLCSCYGEIPLNSFWGRSQSSWVVQNDANAKFIVDLSAMPWHCSWQEP